MKRIYAVQVNYLYGKTAYLPYASGMVVANAFADEQIKQEYSFEGFIYTRIAIQDAMNLIKDPYMVVFSTYVWNFEYNIRLASKIKEQFPKSLIVFGGHQISKNSAQMLVSHPYIDYLIHEEGEIPFHDLLVSLLADSDLSVVPNLSYRSADGEIHTNEVKCFDRIDFPSPYLNGFFDELLKDERYEFSAILETNRGCPFSCSFCDWGTLRSSIRKMPLKKIKDEIKWMCEHRISHIYCADSNFGIYRRDAEIVDFIIECKRQTGYPDKFRACFSKSSNDFIFELNRSLNNAKLSKGATLSFQSLDTKTMKNVGRRNLTIQRYSSLISKYNAEGIPTQTEIIIALPGETYKTFVTGVCNLLKAGQHTSINIYNCEIFPNARLASQVAIEEFGICSIKTPAAKNHCEANEDIEDIEEFDCIICETSSMNREDWIRANLFSYVIQAYHCLGLLQIYAIYLFYEQHVEYEDFYTKFLDWSLKNKKTISGNILSSIEERLRSFFIGKGTWAYTNPEFGYTSWPFEEGIFLEMIAKYDDFSHEVAAYIQANYDIENRVLVDLCEYQKVIVKVPEKKLRDICLKFDFPRYIRAVYNNKHEPLKETKCIIRVANTTCEKMSLPEYAKLIVWYGRKGGKNIYSDTELEIEYCD